LQSRRDDSSIREREEALHTLDLAYHKYREITRNLDEGLQVFCLFIILPPAFDPPLVLQRPGVHTYTIQGVLQDLEQLEKTRNRAFQ